MLKCILTFIVLQGQSSGPEWPCTPLKLNGPAPSRGPFTRTLAPRGLKMGRCGLNSSGSEQEPVTGSEQVTESYSFKIC
jgi:hypothetical protein